MNHRHMRRLSGGKESQVFRSPVPSMLNRPEKQIVPPKLISKGLSIAVP